MVYEARLREAVDYIEAHPEEWDQSAFERYRCLGCGTARCLAGTAIALYYNIVDGYINDFVWREGAFEVGMRILGLARWQAEILFLDTDGKGSKDIEPFKERITEITGVEFKQKENVE